MKTNGTTKNDLNEALDTIRRTAESWEQFFQELARFAIETNKILPGVLMFTIDYRDGWRGQQTNRTPTAVWVDLFRNKAGSVYDRYEIRKGQRPMRYRYALKDSGSSQDWRCIKVGACTASEFVGVVIKKLDQLLKMQAEPSTTLHAIRARLVKPVIHLQRTTQSTWRASTSENDLETTPWDDEETAISDLLGLLAAKGEPSDRSDYTVILLPPPVV